MVEVTCAVTGYPCYILPEDFKPENIKPKGGLFGVKLVNLWL